MITGFYFGQKGLLPQYSELFFVYIRNVQMHVSYTRIYCLGYYDEIVNIDCSSVSLLLLPSLLFPLPSSPVSSSPSFSSFFPSLLSNFIATRTSGLPLCQILPIERVAAETIECAFLLVAYLVEMDHTKHGFGEAAGSADN